MFDQERMFHLIATRPGIRCVELADELNLDRDLVVTQLTPFVEALDLAKSDVPAPNGRTVFAYEFTGKFKARDVYKVLVEPVKSAPVEAITTALPSASRISQKVNAAMDYLYERGRVTTAELKRAMAITCDPNCYLGPRVTSGHIKRAGKFWYLPDEDRPRVPKVAAPAASPNTCRSESQSEHVAPGPGKAEAPQNTPPSGHPAASEKVEEPETLRDGNAETGSGEVHLSAEIQLAQLVPQEAAPLDWSKTGPSPLRVAPPVIKSPARFLFDENGEYVLRRGFQEFSLTRDEAARFAQFWVSVRDAVPA